MKLNVLFPVLFVTLISCGTKNESSKAANESPLVTVIKLQSAETLADFSSAQPYIDVNKVYASHPDSISPQKAWETKVGFGSSLARDRKFTNVFKYFDYDVKEVINGTNAEVQFTSKNSEEPVKKIVYTLNNKDSKWIVVGIEYIK